jgi:hypothetical protein
MKSTEVYREAREVLAPWCKAHGFKRLTSGLLGWHKPFGEMHLVFSLQCAQGGWDPYAGSKFVAEFQFSPLPRIGSYGAGCVCHRLPYFLTNDELEFVRENQTKVIRSLPKPPSHHFVLQLNQRTVDRYLGKFKEVEEPYDVTDDIWLRYANHEDVRGWAKFLLPVLPRIVQVLTGFAAEQFADTDGHLPT